MNAEREHILAIENSNPSAAPRRAAEADRAGADGGRDAADGPGVAVLRRSGTSAGVSYEVVARESIRTVARDRDDLMPAIERVVRAAKLTPGELNVVAVSVGPGGYTAVRSACSAAKMIAEAVGAKGVNVPSALVAALAAHETGERGAFVVCLAGKDQTSHATRFAARTEWSDLVRDHEPIGLISAEHVESLRVTTLVADRFLPAPIRAAAEGLGMRIIEPMFRAEACGRLASLLPTCDPASINPFYPREPEAVTLWRHRAS